MSDLGKSLIEAIDEAVETGDKGIIMKASPNVAELRRELALSQSEFANAYHININTLQKWEQGKRNPDSVSAAYLNCIAKDPEHIRSLIQE